MSLCVFFFQAEDGIRDLVRSRGLGDVYKRQFHDFNVLYRDDPHSEVVAFTATQIPDIDGRTYPPALAGPHYPHGIPIVDESGLESLIARERVDTVVLAYSCLLYTSDAADERSSVDLGGRRLIKKKKSQ